MPTFPLEIVNAEFMEKVLGCKPEPPAEPVGMHWVLDTHRMQAERELLWTMNANAPDFDPLNCSAEDEAEMLRGYLAAGTAISLPDMMSAPFEHGWRMRRNDRAGLVDDDQRTLARRYFEKQRGL